MNVMSMIRRVCPNIRIVRDTLKEQKLKQLRRKAMPKEMIVSVENGQMPLNEFLENCRESKPKAFAEAQQESEKYFEQFKEKYENESKNEIVSDVIFCCFAYGFTVDEYFAFHLYGKSAQKRRSYISDLDSTKISYYMNDIIDMGIFFDKWRTYQIFKWAFQREAAHVASKKDWTAFCEFVSKYPTFVCKQVGSSRGRGVELIHSEGVDRNLLFKDILKKAPCILEERIVQAEELSAINISSVNTVRIVSLNRNGKISFPYCILRMGHGGSFVDNVSAGGLTCAVDVGRGVLITDGMDERNNIFSYHPDSKIVLKGFQIPQWEALVALAEKLAKCCPSVGYVGWDLAYSDKGWVMVEGNCGAQLEACQVLLGGMKNIFEDALGKKIEKI